MPVESKPIAEYMSEGFAYMSVTRVKKMVNVASILVILKIFKKPKRKCQKVLTFASKPHCQLKFSNVILISIISQ